MSMYKTAYSQYGQSWLGTDGRPPADKNAPNTKYAEVADYGRQKLSGLRKLKAKIGQEMAVEQDSTVFDPSLGKTTMSAFPTRADQMTYPPNQTRGASNPIYLSANREYGRLQPTEFDLPNKYFPRNNIFTGTFVGERIPDTGLNTAMTPSRIHPAFDS